MPRYRRGPSGGYRRGWEEAALCGEAWEERGEVGRLFPEEKRYNEGLRAIFFIFNIIVVSFFWTSEGKSAACFLRQNRKTKKNI